MLTIKLLVRPGCSMLLLCVLVHRIPLQLQHVPVQEAFAGLPVCLKCRFRVIVSHPKISCMNNKKRFSLSDSDIALYQDC
jgi:hypothetical protein